MTIKHANRKLYNLLISEIEKKYGRSSEEKVFVIKCEAIAMLQSEYIKNIRYISGCLCAYFDSKVSLNFNNSGVMIVLTGKKEYKYMTRSHLNRRWGPCARPLIEDFVGAPDKIGTNGKTPTQFYLTERIEEIEKTKSFQLCYHALYNLKINNLNVGYIKAAM